MKTQTTKMSTIKREWHLLDAKGQVLGRLASKIGQLLMGKNKLYFVSHLDCGDWVVVINAKKVAVTGKKKDNKIYAWHTNYPQGFRQLTYKQMMLKDPTKIIYHAVSGMLPKNKLRDKRLTRLKIFAGEEHKYKDKFK